MVVAVMQIGVLVAGVLGAGLVHRHALNAGVAMPFPALMLYTYGLMGFAIPIVWSVVTLTLQSRAQVSDEVKSLMFGLGVVVLIALGVFVVYADMASVFYIGFGRDALQAHPLGPE